MANIGKALPFSFLVGVAFPLNTTKTFPATQIACGRCLASYSILNFPEAANLMGMVSAAETTASAETHKGVASITTANQHNTRGN